MCVTSDRPHASVDVKIEQLLIFLKYDKNWKERFVSEDHISEILLRRFNIFIRVVYETKTKNNVALLIHDNMSNTRPLIAVTNIITVYLYCDVLCDYHIYNTSCSMANKSGSFHFNIL